MIGLTLSLDYEIYGNGQGSVQKLVIEPTQAFIDICGQYDARTTIFVEVAELLKMKEYDALKADVDAIETQLKHLHESGHDIELHIHPWWFNARHQDGSWQMDYELSSLCNLDTEAISHYVKLSRNYLIDLLKDCNRSYECKAFRAGYWCMMPTRHMHDALFDAGIRIDSSVFKWGVLQTNLMSFDYRNAQSNLIPWFVNRENINQANLNPCGQPSLLEVPIYTEMQRGILFLNLKRIYLMRKVKSVMIENSKGRNNISLATKLTEKFRRLICHQAKKLDFCKCSIPEMKRMTANIVSHNPVDGYLPVVAIGHSKDFLFKNDLRTFLSFIKKSYSGIVEMVPLTESVDKYLPFRQKNGDMIKS